MATFPPSPARPIRPPPPPPRPIRPPPPPPPRVPPPPPPRVPPPPPPRARPPPPPRVPPPPPPRAPRPPPPRVPPPPPPRAPRPPPPPPRVPPPPPPPVLPPPPPPGPTIIIVVFISFGCIFFLAFCLFALWWLIKKRRKRAVQVTDIIRTDEHLKVKEAIVKGPDGPKTLVLSVEEDKHTEEEIIKDNEEMEGKHMHAKSGQVSATDDHLEAQKSSPNPGIHHRSQRKH